MNHYDVLSVIRSASLEDIKLNYRNLLLQYHPDKIQQNSLPNNQLSSLHLHNCLRFYDQIQLAWKMLSDPLTRQEYDEELKRLENVGKNADIYYWNENFTNREEDGFYEGTVQTEKKTSGESKESSCWKKECRCGDEYIVRFVLLFHCS
jgi:diphthamide biosynthesis protein 4